MIKITTVQNKQINKAEKPKQKHKKSASAKTQYLHLQKCHKNTTLETIIHKQNIYKVKKKKQNYQIDH